MVWELQLYMGREGVGEKQKVVGRGKREQKGGEVKWEGRGVEEAGGPIVER